MPSLKMLTVIAVASLNILPFALANPLPLERRELLTRLPPSATSEQEKWCPSLDYDQDSCYNTVAISPTGQLNAGQDHKKGKNTILGFCRNEKRLHNTNIYVRSRCNNGWCVHLYDYYFESDFTAFGIGGHRHDWEHIAVWVSDGQLKFISISKHGKWEIRENPGGGSHVKVVYHQDGALTHAFRYAKDRNGDEPPENHWQSWRWGMGAGLIEWERIPGHLRNTLSQKDWGTAQMAVRDKDGSDWNFGWYLDQSRRKCSGGLGREPVYCIRIAEKFSAWG